jgi:hypothetical protein
MNTNIATQITKNSLTVVVNNSEVFTVQSGQSNWNACMAALKENDYNKLVEVIQIKNAVNSFSKGNIVVDAGRVLYKSKELHGVDVDRVLGFIAEGLPSQPMLNFLEKKQLNPSLKSIRELYTFLEHKNLPISPSGNFLAYKGLRSDYYSITAGKLTLIKGKVNEEGRIYNAVGEEIECLRNEVDDETNNHCSVGLHVGSLEYATSFAGSGGKVVPNDCNCQKLRTCAYKVVGEYTGPLPSTYTDEYSNDEDSSWESDDVSDSDDEDTQDNDCCGDKDCICSDNIDNNEYNRGYEKGQHDWYVGNPRRYTSSAMSPYGRVYSYAGYENDS